MADSTQQKVTRAERHRAALAVAKASPTQHVPRHVTSADVHQQMAGDSAAGRFNSRLAVLITRGVGTITPPVRFLCRPEVVLITLE